ncbi:MAG: SUMF1/EgtB/PvdO family nonheme iron enzyme [Anaerolineae bacterium]|nr:SUMF1/EgtB/PvdO family nonheme iron enzyme [Anaerolineae bacterium]
MSPYGAHDLAGNAWEWVSSKYGSYPYRGDDGREDQSSTDVRVLRGGSWLYEAWLVRSASRDWFDPGYRVSYVGFRVASPGL